jgi:hypothetical protein
MLDSFSQSEISVDEVTKDFKPYNNTILAWEIEIEDYWQDEEERGELISRTIEITVKEALVKIKNDKGKKVEVPGYLVLISEDMYKSGGILIDGFIQASEEFKKQDFKKAVDCYIRYMLDVQDWIFIADSRAALKPERKEQFECPFCGWCSEIPLEETEFKDTCLGCGKRFWDLSKQSQEAIENENTKPEKESIG